MAQEAKPTPAARKPIIVRWNTMKGMNYYLSGVKVNDHASLEKIILPLNDPEATRLLKLSEDSKDSGVFFLVAGLPLTLGGGIVEGVAYNHGINSDTGAEVAGGIGLIVGLVGDYVGLFKLAESQTSQFAAVQRYNLIVTGNGDLSWNQPKPSLNLASLTIPF